MIPLLHRRRPRHPRWVVAVLTTVALAASACVDDDSSVTAGTLAAVPTTTATSAAPGSESTPTTIREFTPAELGVELDPDGRPYDEVSDGDPVAEVDIGTVHFADGAVRVLDGNVLEVNPAGDVAQLVDFGDHEDLEVTLLERANPEWSSPVGMRLDVPGTSVARWEPFEFAYGTDGGIGAVTSDAVIELASERRERQGDEWEAFIPDSEIDYEAAYQTFDLDGRPGTDSVIFNNGLGDGGFPMSRGLDDDGEIVSLVIWTVIYPWRLAVTDGTPPVDVTEREQELADCLAGRRPVEDWKQHGFSCRSDSDS